MLHLPLLLTLTALVAPLFVLAQQQTHRILVGAGGLRYTPSNLSAAVGDKIEFLWTVPLMAMSNHSVVQSSFDAPCTPLMNRSTNIGFDSGFNPVKTGAKSAPAWTLEITNASAPIWYFCTQTSHCQQGMVGSINAATTGNKTFDAFRAAAMGAAANGTNGGATAMGSGVGAAATGPVSTAAPSGAAASGASPSTILSGQVSALVVALVVTMWA